MWKPLRTRGDSPATVLYEWIDGRNAYTIRLFDNTAILEETLRGDEVLRRNEDLNPAIEINNPEDLLPEIGYLLESEKAHVKLRKQPDSRDKSHLLVVGKYQGYSFQWKFELTKVDEASFIKHFSNPVLNSVSHLLSQKRHLIDIIKAKDAELAELYETGATLTRHSLRTDPFDCDKMVEKYLSEPNDSPLKVLSSPEYLQLQKEIALARSSQVNVADTASHTESSAARVARRRRIKVKGALGMFSESVDEDDDNDEAGRTRLMASQRTLLNSQANKTKAAKDKESDNKKKMIAKRLKKL